MNIWAKRTAQECFQYADLVKVRYQQNSKEEELISQNAGYSYLYANHIIKGPWLKGEKTISTCAGSSYLYAINCLNFSRFTLGEEAMKNFPDQTFWELYCQNILNKIFPKN